MQGVALLAAMSFSRLSRRHFLTLAAGSGLASLASAQPHAPVPTPSKPPGTAAAPPPKPPALAPEMVKEFVGAGHGNLAKVKEMLAAQPGLKNACWDWGGGDFETALGGAAHMGQREIAEYLIAQGSRMDVFAAAMLGRLDVVKAACAAFPDTPSVPGPHGIPLLVHAQKGGAQAAAVVEFLQSLKK